MTKDRIILCKYCGEQMKKWQVPVDSTWSEEFHFVCFNDDCPYFVRGWEQTMQTQNRHASYRYKVNPTSGKGGPLPVWSYDAHRNQIID